MSVTTGQTANAVNFNNAFCSRTQSTSTSGSLTVGGNVVASVQAGVTAFAGGGQGSATAITKDLAFVTTVASSGDSVKLPAGVAGLSITVYNQGASTLAVFPFLGEQIDDQAVNISTTVEPGQDRVFMCRAIGLWYTDAGVDGPVSATANAIPRYSGTSGDVIKDSPATIDDSGRGAFVGITSTNDSSFFGDSSNPFAFAVNGGVGEFNSGSFVINGSAVIDNGCDLNQINGKGIAFYNVATTQNIYINAEPTTNYSLQLPGSQGAADTMMVNDGAGLLSWSNDLSLSGLEMNANVISDVADPVAAQDAATKNYVDSVVPSGFAPTVQKFTSGSGTYTTPAGPAPSYIKVKTVGGGGGGGGSGTGGGGGGGGSGGNTTFGTTLLVSNGGSGGAGGGSGGAVGGSVSLGSAIGTAIVGGTGGSGANVNTGESGGDGAATPLGGGGGGGSGTGAAGSAGYDAPVNSGGGGGGAGMGNAGSGSGGGGAAGGFVDAIITSPGASYSYAVGAAGTAGTAGTSGSAGGAGGSGYIIVEEYY